MHLLAVLGVNNKCLNGSCVGHAHGRFFITHDLLKMVTDVAIVVAVPTTFSPAVPFSGSFVAVCDHPDFVFSVHCE